MFDGIGRAASFVYLEDKLDVGGRCMRAMSYGGETWTMRKEEEGLMLPAERAMVRLIEVRSLEGGAVAVMQILAHRLVQG